MLEAALSSGWRQFSAVARVMGDEQGPGLSVCLYQQTIFIMYVYS